MSDPLTEVVRLLKPRAVFANLISGKGDWAVRYAQYGQPSFCIMLEGHCCLAVDGHEPVTLSAGDFVLLPSTPPFTLSSFGPAPTVHIDPKVVPVARANGATATWRASQTCVRSAERSCSTARTPGCSPPCCLWWSM